MLYGKGTWRMPYWSELYPCLQPGVNSFPRIVKAPKVKIWAIASRGACRVGTLAGLSPALPPKVSV